MLTLIKSDLFQLHQITPVETLKPRFWDNFEICLLFSRKQQQIFTAEKKLFYSPSTIIQTGQTHFYVAKDFKLNFISYFLNKRPALIVFMPNFP